MKTITIDVGDRVLCDICNQDYTNKNDEGGFLFGSYAYCPKCAKSGIESIRKFNEERYIRARCPAGVSFANFVRGLR